MITQNCGVEDFAATRGFAKHELETFYAVQIERGNPKKAPFALRTIEQMKMLRESGSSSLFTRVIQQVPSFQKGTVLVNMVFESSSSSTSGSAAATCDTATFTSNTTNYMCKTPKKPTRQALLNPSDLHFLLPHAQSSVLGESAEHPERESYGQPAEVS